MNAVCKKFDLWRVHDTLIQPTDLMDASDQLQLLRTYVVELIATRVDSSFNLNMRCMWLTTQVSRSRWEMT